MLDPIKTTSSKGRQRVAFDTFMLELDKDPGKYGAPEQASDALLSSLVEMAESHNRVAGKGDARDTVPQSLPPYMAAALACRYWDFRMVDMLGTGRRDDNCLLAVYVDDVSDADYGTYSIADFRINNLVRRISPDISLADLKCAKSILQDTVPLVKLCRDRNLVAVGNGIFDLSAKVLNSFTPSVVFLSKIRADYDAGARDMPIREPDGSMWTFDSWMDSLNSDDRNVAFLWQVLGMLVRPNLSWEKMVLLYSERGNNGKGTFCSLARNLLGDGNHASIKLSDFNRDFAMTELLHVQSVICDENDVGIFIDGAANLKAAITGDVISVNRKYKDPVSMRFRGTILQCINGMPKVKDKSESFLRRLVFVKMDKCFTGHAKKYIKDDYLKRREVLEYVLKRLLEMDLDENSLIVPESSEEVKEEYRAFNDPVCAFWEEFRDKFVWNLLPYTFLYELYKKWFDVTNPRGKVVSHRQFIQDIKGVVATDTGWSCGGRNQCVWTGHKMDAPERLIIDWELSDWMDRGYKGNDWKRQVSIPRSTTYRGLERLGTEAGDAGDDVTENGLE